MTTPETNNERSREADRSADLLDHAMMDILSDAYGAYHLIPDSDRNEYEAKYGKPNTSMTGGEPAGKEV